MSEDMIAAEVLSGRRLVFHFTYDGGGQSGEVERTEHGIVFLTDGRRIRWDAVLWVTDE